MTHLRSLDTRYRAALKPYILAENQPPMYLTLDFLAIWHQVSNGTKGVREASRKEVQSEGPMVGTEVSAVGKRGGGFSRRPLHVGNAVIPVMLLHILRSGSGKQHAASGRGQRAASSRSRQPVSGSSARQQHVQRAASERHQRTAAVHSAAALHSMGSDATARLAVRRHLPTTEHAHFSQYKSAQTLYDAVVARYSSPATAALSRLFLPYLFPDLAAFPTVADLITHLRTSDTRYRAALPAELCAKNPPPIYLTLYYV
ncbi:unnamed protein product, partial [Closterium sp. NIES-54]